MSELRQLQAWFQSQCDGDWEHGHGVKIETLDNPGWTVSIRLDGTDAEDRAFAEVKDHYDHHTDWLRCWREQKTFRGGCGPARLVDVLRIFVDWVAASSKPPQSDGPSGRR